MNRRRDGLDFIKTVLYILRMPIGTAFHEKTFALCESLNYREWSGYYTVSAHDATRLVDRIVTRDMRKVSVGQVIYTPWCDEQGKVIDDGTVSRLDENTYRWTAADPSLRWFHQNAQGMDVEIDDISEKVAALAVQGPTSGGLLQSLLGREIGDLKYFHVTQGEIAGVRV